MIEDFYSTVFERWTNAPAVTFPYDLTPTLVGTFAGGLTRLNCREQWLDDKMTLHASHRIYCPSGTTLALTDQLKYSGRTFEIRDIDAIEIRTGHHIEILVDEVQ